MVQRPSQVSLARYTLLKLHNKIRILILKASGLTVGKMCLIEKIYCEWPSKLQFGNDCHIQANITFWTKEPYNLNNYIVVGNKVFIGRGCEFNCSSHITIGDNCLIASHCIFADVNHSYDKSQLINLQPITTAPIVLESDVWIGTGSIILKGVTLGEGSIVAAGSLVNRSIPPYEIWGGTPAKYLANRK